ncbi:MAG: anthranilate phosphoribosyltransferase [Rhodothalassiaceae bacterium]
MLKEAISSIAGGRTLSREAARTVFSCIMSGEAQESQVAALLMGLAVRGETVEEIAGGADALRAHATPVRAGADVIDTCGTGGDGLSTFNISTAAAIVAAAAGVPVAKHGNRAVSSKSGSADVLERLGIALDSDPERVARSIETLGIGFLMAPRHHSAMRHVAPVRAALGIRTIFNLLGPLSNPAHARYQLIGVFGSRWLRPMAEALALLGSERAWVVHGSDGLDEITISGESHVIALEHGELREFSVHPEDAGLPCHSLDTIIGGDADLNARALRALLEGVGGPYRDVVLLNSAAALIVGGRAATLREGAERAAEAIDSGAALRLLEAWRDFV